MSRSNSANTASIPGEGSAPWGGHVERLGQRHESNADGVERWSVDADGKTMHARFDDTQGHVQEQDGHKVQ
jgi:hypothetical protein